MVSNQPVQHPSPGFLDDFTANHDEIHHLLSLFQSTPALHSTSGSSQATQSVYSMEERKRRRMLSNRLSARKSRLRKKRYLEDLTNQVNRLRFENRELKNRLFLVTHQCLAAQRETDRLITESIVLQQELTSLNQVLLSMHFQ